MSKPKLLLADDSITIQKVVNLTFADQGMDVITFSDGDAAIENFDTVKPDIVLADVHMPGVNGYQLCELLRSDAESSKIPVVLLVGSFEPFDREEAERVGASGYLTKPFTSIAQLVSTVENLLAGAPAVPAAAEAHGDEPTVAEAQAADAESPEIETDHAAPVGEAPGPDTTDIDHLYKQSFVETVEIPREEGEELEFDEVALDDEMIQTSYGEPDPNHEIDGSYYAEDAGIVEGTAESPELETETLIAETALGEMPGSVPISGEAPDNESAQEEMPDTAASIPEETFDYEPVAEETPHFEPASEEVTHFEPEPEPEKAPSYETTEAGSQAEAALGPFDTIATELPPIEHTSAPSPGTGFHEMDVLELPVTPRASRSDAVVENARSDRPREITNLSPELIDLIVEKVVARLAEKQSTAAGE